MNAHTPIEAAQAEPVPAPSVEAPDLAGLTARVVGAYVSRNSVPAAELPALLGRVHGALTGLTQEVATGVRRATDAEIRASIRTDALVSFEDGRPYKALRRHLTLRGLTPEDYRRKWGLPVDYPMVTAAYSARRSEISRAIGLGTGSRQPEAVS